MLRNRRAGGPGNRWPFGTGNAAHREAMRAARERTAIERPLQMVPGLDTSAATTEPIRGLGRLAELPNEVVMVVIGHCTPRAVLRLLCVNRAFAAMVKLLPDFEYIFGTAKGIMERAKPAFKKVFSLQLRFLTYNGLRGLLLGRQCESCGGTDGTSFRLNKVKVLCDRCFDRPRSRVTW